MKANELRIGNLILLTKDNFKTTKEYRLYGIDIYKLDESECIDIKPIPLTEELLLKLEAVKLDFKDYPSYNLKGIQINFINGMWIEYVSRIEITGLHHLQNIFYFRMNEELEIK